MRSADRSEGGWRGVALRIAFLVVWSGGTIALDVFVLSRIYWQLRAEHYLQTVGTITHCEVYIVRDSDVGGYNIDVQYTYRVDGRKYRGHRYRYFQDNFSDRTYHRIAERLPVGTHVPVYYDPQAPGEAVLKTGVEGVDLHLLLFALPFNVTLVGLVLYVLRGGRQGAYWRPRSRVRVLRYGLPSRLWVTGRDALRAALLTFWFASIFAIILVPVLFGFNPPIPAVLAGYLVALGLPAAVYVRCRIGFDSGLTLEDEGEAIRFTPDGEDGPCTVPLTAIRRVGLSLDLRKKFTTGDKARVVGPKFTVVDANGESRRVKVRANLRPREGRTLVTWLNRKIRRARRRAEKAESPC